VLEGLNYQACACIICGRNNRQNCGDATATFYLNISAVASRVNVNSRIVFLEERKIYKVKWHDTMPPVTFTSVINISSSSLFQVSFRSPFTRGERWPLGLRRSTQLHPLDARSSTIYISFFEFRKIRVSW